VTDGLRALEAAGCSRLLFSNNPTRGADHYGEQLAPHGIDIDPATVLTSATVSAEYLAATHPDERVYLVGSERLEAILDDAAVELTADPDAAEVVLGSFDKDFSYGTLWESLRALEGMSPSTAPIPTRRSRSTGRFRARVRFSPRWKPSPAANRMQSWENRHPSRPRRL